LITSTVKTSQKCHKISSALNNLVISVKVWGVHFIKLSKRIDRIGLHGKPSSELRDVACLKGSQSDKRWAHIAGDLLLLLPPDASERVRLNPNQTSWYSIYLPRWVKGWVELGGWLHNEML